MRSFLVSFVIVSMHKIVVSSQETVESCKQWPFDASKVHIDPQGLPFKRLRPSILEKGYDRMESPAKFYQGSNANGTKVDVSIKLLIEELLPFDDQDKEISLTMTIFARWNDPRLEMDPNCREKLNMTEKCVRHGLPQHLVDFEYFQSQFWQPPLNIKNLKSVESRNLFFKDKHGSISRCSGNIGFRSSVKLTLSCSANFRWYPFDTQQCDLIFVSMRGSWANNVNLKWGAMKPSLLTYERTGIMNNEDETMNGNWDTKILYSDSNPETSNNLKCRNDLRVHFVFYRSHISHYVQSVIPGMLMVLASFGSLFVPHDQIPGRMTLAITTTLTLMAMMNSAFDIAPRTAYLKALDIWLIMCFCFTFAALGEFCVVIFLSKSFSGKRSSVHPSKEEDQDRNQENRMMMAKTIERVAKIAFPTMFLIFFLIFFSLVNFHHLYDKERIQVGENLHEPENLITGCVKESH